MDGDVEAEGWRCDWDCDCDLGDDLAAVVASGRSRLDLLGRLVPSPPRPQRQGISPPVSIL